MVVIGVQNYMCKLFVSHAFDNFEEECYLMKTGVGILVSHFPPSSLSPPLHLSPSPSLLPLPLPLLSQPSPILPSEGHEAYSGNRL